MPRIQAAFHLQRPGRDYHVCLTGANVDDRDPKVWAVLGKKIYGKLFADRGYILPNLFDALFADGVHLVTGIRNNMKNKLMILWDKIMLRKRYIIECINLC